MRVPRTVKHGTLVESVVLPTAARHAGIVDSKPRVVEVVAEI